MDAADLEAAVTEDEQTTETISAIRKALSGYVFRVRDEAELQDLVSEILTLAELDHRREAIAPGGRFDILVAGGVVLELKRQAAASAVERQAQRYALVPDVKAVLVVTTSSRLAHQLADYPYSTLGGKPFGAIALRTT